MKNSVVRLMVLINVLVFCGLIASFAQRHYHQQSQRQSERAEADRIVREAEKNDKTPQSEKDRLNEISHQVELSKTLSDDQFSFLLTEMNKPSQQGNAVSRLTAVLTLDWLKQPLPPSQKSMLYQQLTPILAVPDTTPTSGITMKQMRELEACDLLAKFDVREAVPQIMPLLDDPKPQIRNSARKALQKLGYNA